MEWGWASQRGREHFKKYNRELQNWKEIKIFFKKLQFYDCYNNSKIGSYENMIQAVQVRFWEMNLERGFTNRILEGNGLTEAQ